MVMRLVRAVGLASLLALFFAAMTVNVSAQQVGPAGAINVQKDCQTIVNCEFRKGRQFRGCVSSFSCRRCRFVRTKCQIGNDRRTCRRLRCTWG